MSGKKAALYEDAKIRCDRDGLTIRDYYPWGAKRIRYASVKGDKQLPLTGLNSSQMEAVAGDLLHWWNLDGNRPGKRVALVLDVGRRIRPTITPDDPSAVERILNARVMRG